MTDIEAIKEKFFKSLKCGTGEAYFIARNNPDIDFSEYIIEGAVNDYAYDGQSEGSRAWYIYNLITLSSEKEKIRGEILKHLATHTEDTWTLVQLFELAKLFAEEGDKEAKQAIYNRFGNNIIEGSDWVGYDEILELDDIEGLIFVTHKFGQLLEQDPNDSQNDDIINYFQDANPDIDAIQILQEEAKSNKYVQLYLDCIQKPKQSSKKLKSQKSSFKYIKDRIEKSQFHYIAPRKVLEKLTSEEIQQLADDFLVETDYNKLTNYLSVFSTIKFPYGYKAILEMAKQKPIDEYGITKFSSRALGKIQADEIREFAIETLKNTKIPDLFSELLISNYREGDAKLLTTIAERFEDEDMIEGLACSYVKIYQANKTKECKKPLLELYKKMTCGIHRNYVIEILIENDVLPEYINNEIEFDSYEETRKLYRKS